MECTEVRDCGEYRHPTAGIGYAFLEFGHAGLARDLHDCEDGVHFGQVSFVVVLVNHDDAPTWTRSLFKACSAACKSVCQSLPQRRASMAHHARQSLGQVPVEELLSHHGTCRRMRTILRSPPSASVRTWSLHNASAARTSFA